MSTPTISQVKISDNLVYWFLRYYYAFMREKNHQCASDCDSLKLITCGALLITFYWGQPFIEKMCGSHQKRHKMPRQVDHIYPKSNTNLEKSMHCRASLSLFKCGSQPAIWRKNTTFLLLMYSHRKISTE